MFQFYWLTTEALKDLLIIYGMFYTGIKKLYKLLNILLHTQINNKNFAGALQYLPISANSSKAPWWPLSLPYTFLPLKFNLINMFNTVIQF